MVLSRFRREKNRLPDEILPVKYGRAGTLVSVILKNNQLNDLDKTFINIPHLSIISSCSSFLFISFPSSIFFSLALLNKEGGKKASLDCSKSLLMLADSCSSVKQFHKDH